MCARACVCACVYLHRCDEPFYTVAQSLCSKHTVHFHPRATRPNDPTPANTEKPTDSSEHKHTNPTYTHWKRNRALKQAASLTVPSLRTGDQIYSALGFLNPDPTTAAELRTSIDTKHTHTHCSRRLCKGYTERAVWWCGDERGVCVSSSDDGVWCHCSDLLCVTAQLEQTVSRLKHTHTIISVAICTYVCVRVFYITLKILIKNKYYTTPKTILSSYFIRKFHILIFIDL